MYEYGHSAWVSYFDSAQTRQWNVCLNSSSLDTVKLPRKYPDESVISTKLVSCDFIKIVPPARFFLEKFTQLSEQFLKEHLQLTSCALKNHLRKIA